jgi:hypothetical protein
MPTFHCTCSTEETDKSLKIERRKISFANSTLKHQIIMTGRFILIDTVNQSNCFVCFYNLFVLKQHSVFTNPGIQMIFWQLNQTFQPVHPTCLTYLTCSTYSTCSAYSTCSTLLSLFNLLNLLNLFIQPAQPVQPVQPTQPAQPIRSTCSACSLLNLPAQPTQPVQPTYSACST